MVEKSRKVILRIAIVLLAVDVGVELSNLYRYERAGYCQSAQTTSADCITRTPELVVRTTKKVIGSGTVLRGVIVTRKDKTVTLWLNPFPENVRPDTPVNLLSWNGHPFAVVFRDHKYHDYYWEPEVLKVAMIAWVIAAIGASVFHLLFERSRKTRGPEWLSCHQVVDTFRVLYLLATASYSAIIVMMTVDAALNMRLLL